MPIFHRLTLMFLLWKKASSFLILREMTINPSGVTSSQVFGVELHILQRFSFHEPVAAHPLSHQQGHLNAAGRVVRGAKQQPLLFPSF